MPLYGHWVEYLCKALHGSVQPFTGFYILLCRYGCKSSLWAFLAVTAFWKTLLYLSSVL